jgi:AcrR family transcriptional regulator
VSLRERKKQQTREAISGAAWRLFAERGFEGVTVAEVAREADVSEGTVFNYFPTKEDLVYSQMAAFEAELVDAVRTRKTGESVLEAFRRVILERGTALATPEHADFVAKAARMVAASPALQARQREIVDRSTRQLADVIAEDTRPRSDSVEPLVVAHALMGVQQALQQYVWDRALSGQRGAELAAGVRTQVRAAFARLERGLGHYARRPSPG